MEVYCGNGYYDVLVVVIDIMILSVRFCVYVVSVVYSVRVRVVVIDIMILSVRFSVRC